MYVEHPVDVLRLRTPGRWSISMTIAKTVEQRMELNGSLGAPELCPVESDRERSMTLESRPTRFQYWPDWPRSPRRFLSPIPTTRGGPLQFRESPTRPSDPEPEVYSYLSASLGSTEAARRAGAKQANPATATNSTAKPPRMIGSRELSVSHFCASLWKIRLSASPAANPPPTLTEVAESTSRTTSQARAPSAMRIPNSLVLVATL